MSEENKGVKRKPKLGPIVANGAVMGYRGRGAAFKVGAKDFCVVGIDDAALKFLANEWLAIDLDQTECRDAVFLQRSKYDALLEQNERMREALSAAEQCIGELPPTLARVEAMQMIQAALASQVRT